MAARSLEFAPRPVWSDGSASWLYHVFSDALPTAGAANARPWIKVEAHTGNLDLEVFYETSDTGLSFASPTKLGTITASDDGTVTNSGFADISAGINGKRFWRVGLRCKNSSGSNRELAHAGMGVDFTD